MCQSNKVHFSGWGWQGQVYRPRGKSQQGKVTGYSREGTERRPPPFLSTGRWEHLGLWHGVRADVETNVPNEETLQWKGSFLPRLPQWSSMPLGRPPSLGQSVQVWVTLQEITSFTYHSFGHSHLINTYQMPTLRLTAIRSTSYLWGCPVLEHPMRKKKVVDIGAEHFLCTKLWALQAWQICFFSFSKTGRQKSLFPFYICEHWGLKS